MDELERRLELAMSAGTVHELAELVDDVPRVAIPAPVAEPPGRVRVGLPGIRPFARRIEVPARIDRVRRNVLDTVAVGLNSAGYELIYQDPETLRFQRSTKERLTIDLEEHGRANTMMIVYGRASWRTRRASPGFISTNNRVEQYLTDPSRGPDPAQWRTELAYLIR